MSWWLDVLGAARAEPVDVQAVQRLVRDVWPAATVVAVEPLRGGLGSLLDVVTLTGPGPAHAVLRRLLPEFGATADGVRREADDMRAVRAAGVATPRVLHVDADGAALGRPTLILELVAGHALVRDLGGDDAVQRLAEVVAAVGTVPGAVLPAAPRLTTAAAVLDHLPIDAAASTLVDRAALVASMQRRQGAVAVRDDLVHCDLHGGNVLWDGTTVTGVLDWGYPARTSRWLDWSYAALDTGLAHGLDAGDRLRTAVAGLADERPGEDERLLWDAVALLTASPSPRPWAATYRAHGCDDADDETVEDRYVQLVERHLEEAT